MSSPTSARAYCPECGAEIAAGQTRCWLCQRQWTALETPNPYASPQPVSNNAGSQFSLASLFLITTLVAVCLGVFLLAPGLGILLGFFALPAIFRTAIDVRKHKQRGAPLGVLGKVGSFLVSLILVVAVTMASVTAAFTVCYVGAGSTGRGFTSLALMIAGAGLATGLAVFSGLFWLTGPRGLTWEELWRRGQRR